MNRSVIRSVGSLLLFLAILPAGCRRADEWLRLDGRSELRIALPTGPLHLDPHLDAEEISNIFYHHLFDPLVFLDENLTVRPWLARSWSNPDPRTWLFNLRADAVFQRRPVTAADVASAWSASGSSDSRAQADPAFVGTVRSGSVCRHCRNRDA